MKYRRNCWNRQAPFQTVCQAAAAHLFTRTEKRSRIINTNTGTNFNVGDKVSHKAFGEGIVSQVKGEGDNTELDIVFKTAGPKRLLANYAPLEKRTDINERKNSRITKAAHAL